MPNKKPYEEMTRQERVDLMLEDSDAYIDLVPEGHWLLVLDGMAKLPPVTDNPSDG